MALVHGAAIGGNFIDSFVSSWSGIRPRFDSSSQLYARNDTNSSSTGGSSSSNGPSVNLFVDGQEGSGYAASIVSACKDQTVYAIQCTQAPSSNGDLTPELGSIISQACGPDAPSATITEGPSTYGLSTAGSTSTMGVEVSYALNEQCALSGTTEAVCTASISFSGGADGASTSFSTLTTSTLSGTDYRRFNVAVTGGASLTASATGTCSTGAASSLNPHTLVVYGMVGVAALAGLIAM